MSDKVQTPNEITEAYLAEHGTFDLDRIYSFCDKMGVSALEPKGAIAESIKERLNSNQMATASQPIGLNRLMDIYSHIGKKIEVRARVNGGDMMINPSTKQPCMAMIVEALDGEAIVNVYWKTDPVPLPSGIVSITGIVRAPQPDQKNKNKLKKAYIEATNIEPVAGDWASFRLSDEEIAQIKSVLSEPTYDELKKMAEDTIAPHIRGRSFLKLADMCTVLHPIHTPLAKKKFTLHTAQVGKEREGKDEVADDAASLAPDFVSINAETATSAGLVGGVVNAPELGGFVIKWGALIAAHDGLAHIRGISSFPPERIAELRENISTGKIRINKIKSGERDALSRKILTGNTNRAPDSYPTLYDAVRDIGANGEAIFTQAPDFKRLHILVPIANRVELDQKFDAQFDAAIQAGGDIREAWKLLARASWGSKPEDWIWDMGALKAAGARLAATAKSAKGVELAVFDSQGIYILSAITGAFAVLSGSINDKGQFVATERHVGMAERFIGEMCEELQVPVVQKNLETVHKAADYIGDLIVTAYDTPSNPDSVEDSETHRLLYGAWRHRNAVIDHQKVLSALWNAHNKMTWGELSDSLKTSERTLRRHVAEAEGWFSEETYKKYGKTPALIFGFPSQGQVLTEFGVAVVRKLLTVYSGYENTDVRDQLASFSPTYTINCPSNLEKEKKEEDGNRGSTDPGQTANQTC